MELVILAAAAVAFVVWRIQAVTPVDRPPRNTCVAPLCTEPANLRVSVGHEFYDLCNSHGVPLLTEGLTR